MFEGLKRDGSRMVMSIQYPSDLVALESYLVHYSFDGWGEPTCTLVPWRQGFRHPTKNECMGWFAQIVVLMCNGVMGCLPDHVEGNSNHRSHPCSQFKRI